MGQWRKKYASLPSLLCAGNYSKIRLKRSEVPKMKVEIPGYKELNLEYLVLDYNGTIAVDGMIPQSVKERLEILAKEFQIYVVTADTHGNARKSCEGLPVEIYTFPSSDAAGSKKKIVEELGSENCVCLGNGRNDVQMLRVAGLSVAVMDVEGMYGKLAMESDICVRSMEEGLDLLRNEKRLIATLRG